MQLFIARHGETDWNNQKRLQGHTDIPLNENGFRQATELAKLISEVAVTHILTSNLVRAHEMGRIVSEHLKLPLVIDPRLRECRFGTIEGLTREEIVERYGETFIDSANHVYNFHSVGGERYDEVLKRGLDALSDFYKQYTDAIPLVISHGRIIRTLLGLLKLSDIPAQGNFIVGEFDGG